MQGPNVRRLMYLGQTSSLSPFLNEQGDGTWSARVREHFETGPTAEEAAGKLIEWLEDGGAYVPTPPDDWPSLPT